MKRRNFLLAGLASAAAMVLGPVKSAVGAAVPSWVKRDGPEWDWERVEVFEKTVFASGRRVPALRDALVRRGWFGGLKETLWFSPAEFSAALRPGDSIRQVEVMNGGVWDFPDVEVGTMTLHAGPGANVRDGRAVGRILLTSVSSRALLADGVLSV